MLGRMLATTILSLGLAAGCGGTEAAEAPTSAAGTAESAPPSASAGRPFSINASLSAW